MAPRKKPRDDAAAGPSTEGRVVRRSRGSLQELPDFPLEIQLEVFSNLHPRDLLNLARTCKKFRAFFLHPSNAQLWKAARKSVGDLPERPPFLSEPAFVNLLFFSSCHNCGRSNIRKVIWPWFVRYCPSCLIELSYTYKDIFHRCYKVDPHRIYYDGSLFPLFAIHEASTRTRLDQSHRIHRGHLDVFLDRLREAGPPLTDAARKQIFEEQKQEKEARERYARQCSIWHARQEDLRDVELETKREHRFTEIVSRLRTAGWDKELDFLGNRGLRLLANLPVVRQSAKLTPKTWEKVVEAAQTFLEDTRRRRLREERTAVLQSRFDDLKRSIISHYVRLPRTAEMDFRPLHVDFAMMDRCKAIADAPSTDTVTREDFDAIVPELALAWEQERKNELKEAICKVIGPTEDVDPLGLAVAVFPCTRCPHEPLPRRRSFFHYPAVLGHPCAHSKGPSFNPDVFGHGTMDIHKERDVYVAAAVRPEDRSRSYSPEHFPFSLDVMCRPRETIFEDIIKSVQGIIMELGLDPARATVGDLQGCDARLRCKDCLKWSRGEYEDGVYTWEAAIQHACTTARSFSGVLHKQWTRVDEKDMPLVRELEAEAHTNVASLTTPHAVWVCSRCVDWDGGEDEVAVHLQDQHGLTFSDQHITDGTIYLHQSKGVPFLRPAVILPKEG